MDFEILLPRLVQPFERVAVRTMMNKDGSVFMVEFRSMLMLLNKVGKQVGTTGKVIDTAIGSLLNGFDHDVDIGRG